MRKKYLMKTEKALVACISSSAIYAFTVLFFKSDCAPSLPIKF